MALLYSAWTWVLCPWNLLAIDTALQLRILRKISAMSDKYILYTCPATRPSSWLLLWSTGIDPGELIRDLLVISLVIPTARTLLTTWAERDQPRLVAPHALCYTSTFLCVSLPPWHLAHSHRILEVDTEDGGGYQPSNPSPSDLTSGSAPNTCIRTPR